MIFIGSFAATFVTVNKFDIQSDSIAVPLIMIGFAGLACIIMWLIGNRFRG